jgi:16S rRNA G966 N2-methylase RsmD
MSNIGRVEEELVVGRGDPVYMAHAYLTKVPVSAIIPFIEANTSEGDVVADPFAGSGMTGVAAAACGRRALLSDISVLGQHIGVNYLNIVPSGLLRSSARRLVAGAQELLGDVYRVECQRCHRQAQRAKTVWSVVVECPGCHAGVNYYRSMEQANWKKPKMVCPSCGTHVSSRNNRVGEQAVEDFIRCTCSPNQLGQAPSVEAFDVPAGLDLPHVEITADREMYRASALGKSGMTTVASFYSPRNLAVLAALRKGIHDETDGALSEKLLFAFTAILTRASKRYQWSPQRPLNAANANYYVAPVYYEWNVYELFERKVEACIRSDEWITGSRSTLVGSERSPMDIRYTIQSADSLAYEDASVDYVFTDPPFGSNLFYADMALFQEGWLGEFTDVTQEAVIDRSAGTKRTSRRYEALLTKALSECKRILKPGGRISMVFGNSSGKVWALVQRAVRAAGLRILGDDLVVLNKGQRSVKGLASGFEHVATLDLILTLEASVSSEPNPTTPDREELRQAAVSTANTSRTTPSHIYLEILRHALRRNWSLADLDLKLVTDALTEEGWDVDPKTGYLCRSA